MIMIPEMEAVRDRFDVYRQLNGQVAGSENQDNGGGTRSPLVKSFLLEHVRPTKNRPATEPATIIKSLGFETIRVDDDFLAVIGLVDDEQNDEKRKVLGYLETYEPRFFAFYTTEKSQASNQLVKGWLKSPELDFCWFSSGLLQRFWDEDVSNRGDNLYGKLVFKYSSLFEVFSGTNGMGEDPEDEDDDQDDERVDRERRKARFEMGDRIGEIKRSLGHLQRNYSPLHALYALRFPSRKGKGGHDLYHNGRITNRTDSFEEHRIMVRYLWRCYRNVLNATEEAAWQTNEIKSSSVRPQSRGVPLIVRFSEELSKETFDRWVAFALRRNDPHFRLWGHPIRMGPKKIHVYGADRHLWQPLNLELTSKGLTAILPKETCGNTFHRLVTNIQHYVCPKIDAWLGEHEFSEIATLNQSLEVLDES